VAGTNTVKITVTAADKASAALKGIEKNVGKLTGALKLAAVAGAAAMGAMAVASVKGAADFEKTMSQSVALAGLLPEEVDKVTKALLAMAPAMGKSPQELAEAFYFASSAGLDTEKALAAVTESAKAAAAGLGETKVIVDAVTSVMNAYSLSADKAGRVTDTLVAAVKEGKGEPDALAMAIGKVIPVASQMGVSFEEVSASLAIMTRIGLNADEAATGLRGVLNALIAPGAEAAGVLKQMGTSADEVRAAIKERGLASVLVEMMEALEGNDEALSKLFPDIRAFTGVLATAGNQTEEYQRVLKSIQGDLGITDKAFAEASDTFAFKMGQVKASFDVLKIQIGNALLPALKDLADWFVARLPDIQRFIEDGIRNLQQALQDNKQTLIDAANGIADVGKAFMTFGGWVISNKVALVAALLAIGAALVTLSGPVGIVAGILGIASAIGILAGEADKGSTSLSNLKNNAAALSALPSWANAGNAIANAQKRDVTGRTADSIAEAARWAREDFSNLNKGMKESGAAIDEVNAAANTGIGLFDDYAGGATDAADKISDETLAMIALAATINASGMSWQEYRHRLELTTAVMDAFNLTAGELTAIFQASGLSADQFHGRLELIKQTMEDYNLSGEQMIAMFERSGLAADEFYNRLEALTILNDLKDDANAAADAVNGLYDSMSKIFEKPSQEESQQRFALAQLKEQRAKLIAGGAEPDSRKVKALDEEIDQIEAEIAVRRAHRETLEAEAAAGDKSALADIDQEKAARMVIGAMGPLSTTAADFNAKLFVATWGMSELTKWIVSLTGATSDAQRAMERYARSTPGEREALRNATPEELERLWAGGKAPSFQHGGMMPYTGMAHLEKGETVLKAGQRSSQTFYGPVTVMAPAGSGNSLADLERWLR